MENLSATTQTTIEWMCSFCSLLQSEDQLKNQLSVKVTVYFDNSHYGDDFTYNLILIQMIQMSKGNCPALAALDELISSAKGLYTG